MNFDFFLLLFLFKKIPHLQDLQIIISMPNADDGLWDNIPTMECRKTCFSLQLITHANDWWLTTVDRRPSITNDHEQNKNKNKNQNQTKQ